MTDPQQVSSTSSHPPAKPSLAVVERTIPLDVWILVIDASAGDTLTLKAFAVTRKDFLHRSRFHLFRRVTVRPEGNAYHLAALLERETYIRAAVRELVVCSAATGSQWITDALLTLLPMLCELRKLELQSLSLADPALLKALSRARHSVSQLEVVDCTVASFGDVVRTLLVLPRVNDLNLRTLRCGSSSLSRQAANWHKDLQSLNVLGTSISLSALSIESDVPTTISMGIPRFILWLGQKTRTVSSLRNLVLFDAQDWFSTRHEAYEALAQFSKLESLIIRLTMNNSESVFQAHLGNTFKLSRLPSLKLIAVLGIPTTRIAHCVALLSSVAPAILTGLLLQIIIPDAQRVKDNSIAELPELAALNPVMRSPQFSALKWFNIRCALLTSTDQIGHITFKRVKCRDYILKNCLPDVDPKLWTCEFEGASTET